MAKVSECTIPVYKGTLLNIQCACGDQSLVPFSVLNLLFYREPYEDEDSDDDDDTPKKKKKV